MSSTYNLYGLRLKSDIHLPELSDTIDEGPSDIDVSLGSISSDLIGIAVKGGFFLLRPGSSMTSPVRRAP